MRARFQRYENYKAANGFAAFNASWRKAMFRSDICMPAMLGLAIISSSIGCQAVGRSPLGYRSRQTPSPAEAVVNQSNDAANRGDGGAAAETASERLKTESRALSTQYAAPQDPELTKFANSPGADAAVSASASAGSGVTTSSANSSGSRCTKGCCR